MEQFLAGHSEDFKLEVVTRFIDFIAKLVVRFCDEEVHNNFKRILKLIREKDGRSHVISDVTSLFGDLLTEFVSFTNNDVTVHESVGEFGSKNSNLSSTIQGENINANARVDEIQKELVSDQMKPLESITMQHNSNIYTDGYECLEETTPCKLHSLYSTPEKETGIEFIRENCNTDHIGSQQAADHHLAKYMHGVIINLKIKIWFGHRSDEYRLFKDIMCDCVEGSIHHTEAYRMVCSLLQDQQDLLKEFTEFWEGHIAQNVTTGYAINTAARGVNSSLSSQKESTSESLSPVSATLTGNNSERTLMCQLSGALPDSLMSEQTVNVTSSPMSEPTVNVISSLMSKQIENVTSSPMSEHTMNVISSPMSEQTENVISSSMSEQCVNVTTSSMSEQTENVISSSMSEQCVNVTTSSMSEQTVNVTSSPMSEQTEHVISSSMSEQCVNMKTSSMREQTKNVIYSLMSEQTRTMISSPKSEQTENVISSQMSEQTKNMTSSPMNEQFDNETSLLMSEQTKNVTFSPMSEQNNNVIPSLMSEQFENVTTSLMSEQTDNVTSSLMSEQTESVIYSPMSEQTNTVTSSLMSEQTDNVTYSLMSEQTENVTSSPVSEQFENVTSSPVSELIDIITSSTMSEQTGKVRAALINELTVNRTDSLTSKLTGSYSATNLDEQSPPPNKAKIQALSSTDYEKFVASHDHIETLLHQFHLL